MNWRALVALVFGIAPCVLGFVGAATSIKVGGFRMEPAGRVTDEQSFP
jgi:hypothetical protein